MQRQTVKSRSHQRVRRIAGAVALVLGSVSLGALAAPMGPGGYIGAGLGESTMKDARSDTGFIGTTTDDRDTAVKVFGGYMFNPNFGLELGYVDFGEFTGDSPRERWEATGVTFAVVGVVPLPDVSSNFALFGKLGFNAWSVDDTVTSGGLSTRATSSGTDPMYGIGAEFQLSRNAGINLQWERFADVGDPELTGRSDLDLVSLNFVYRFHQPTYRYRYPYRR